LQKIIIRLSVFEANFLAKLLQVPWSSAIRGKKGKLVAMELYNIFKSVHTL